MNTGDSLNSYAAALSLHPIPVEAGGEVAGQILERFDGERPDLLVCFASPHHTGAFEDIASGLAHLLEPEAFIGATAGAVAGTGREVEDQPALSVFAARFGGGLAHAFTLQSIETADGVAIVGWPDDVPDHGTLLLLADPFSFPVNDFLRLCNDQVPGLTIVGGMASAAAGPGGNRLTCDGGVFTEGAVAVLLDDDVAVRAIVSQGCRPIGQPFTVTKAERNLVTELAGQRAITRLQEVAAALPDEEQGLLQQGVHVGLVVDEHKSDFGRGDFLVRNLLGADERSGGLAVGEFVDVGQTVQFHVRDAQAADEDLRLMLRNVAGEGALLFTCNGRGRHLFGKPDHDAQVVEERLGPVPLAGAFCAGEIGPVGGRNFLHGFTASLLVFGGAMVLDEILSTDPVG
jgi:small ligand-binding sensory domain FIST